MSSQLKTAIVVDDSAIVDGNTIDAANHTIPLGGAEAQLREGQASVSSADTNVKHLEDAIVGTAGGIKITKQDTGADESLQIDIDATGVTSSYVLTANGSNGYSWAASGGGGAAPVDVTGTAGEDLALRDYVYLDESSGTWFKLDTDATPIKCGRYRGIVHTGAISSAATGSIRLIGEVSGYAGLTAWQPVYASTTPGAITQTRPSPTSGGAQVAIIPIGLAISTTNIVVLPQQPVQYMKRDDVANDGTLTIEHHPDEMAHTRRAFAYIGSSEDGVAAVQYVSSNQDVDVPLRDRVVATYGSDVCTGGTASAETSGGGTPASQAFNDNNSNAWGSAAATTVSWLKYDLGASNEKTVRQYNITAFNIDRDPTEWTFEGSNNDSDWDVLDTQSAQVFSSGETKTYQIDNSTAYRYYRLDITGSSGATINVAEVDMMEAATYDDGDDKLAQTFTLASETNLASVGLWLKKIGSPTGTGTIRIETVSSGDPTGTLVDANATGTFAESGLGTSYAEETVSLADTVTLAAGTYALVLSTDRSASETNYIAWGADGSAPSYSGGEMLSEISSTWSAETKDAIFTITSPGTTFVEPAILGRWSGGTRDAAIRYDDGTGSDGTTQTTIKNVIGAEADVTLVVEVP